MRKGLFLVIEGVEGAGKTSSMQNFAEVLRHANKQVHITREPGGTKLGEEIRKLVLHSEDKPILPLTELLLIFAARTQHIQELIRPRLAKGEWVLCDRFTDSSYAYQGAAKGVRTEIIKAIEQIVLDGLCPDVVLLLDLPVSEGRARKAQMNLIADRMEKEDIAFHQRVRDCYLQRAKSNPDSYIVIDANQDQTTVQQSIVEAAHTVIKRFG